MSIFPQIVEHHGTPGFTEFTFAPTYNPTVAIYDIKVDQAFEAVMAKCRKGVFVLIETQRDATGKHKIFVGSSGVDTSKKNLDGKGQFFFERIMHRKSDKPDQAEKWDKAIFLCDWEEDIFWAAKSKAIQGKRLQKSNIVAAMKKEVSIMERMLFGELKKFDKNGSLKLKQSKGRISQNILAPDSKRYEHYVKIVMFCLERIVPNYNLPPTKKP